MRLSINEGKKLKKKNKGSPFYFQKSDFAGWGFFFWQKFLRKKPNAMDYVQVSVVRWVILNSKNVPPPLHWADSVIESPCLSVCPFVSLDSVFFKAKKAHPSLKIYLDPSPPPKKKCFKHPFFLSSKTKQKIKKIHFQKTNLVFTVNFQLLSLHCVKNH